MINIDTKENAIFRISYDKLPPSVNNYLKPKVVKKTARTYAALYETKEAKDFKKLFGEKLKREVRRQNWDIRQTESHQWFLDVIFIQTRIDADSHNYYKILLDSMENIVFANDKNILVRTHRVFYGNKDKQGFQLKLSKGTHVGLFNDKEMVNLQTTKCESCRYYSGGQCSILKAIMDARLVDEFDIERQECKKYTKRKRAK